MQCEQSGCTKDATNTVYWPNQVTQQCDECAAKVVRIGVVMGVNVPVVKHVVQEA